MPAMTPRFLRLLFGLLFFSFAVSAQMPRPEFRDSTKMRQGMRDTAAFRNGPPVGKVIGVLRDSSSRQSIEFASVVVMRMRDSSVAGGALSDNKGQFRIEDLTPGRYFVRITSIGYRQLDSKPFMLTPMDPLKDFSTVWMFPSTRQLKETEVVGEKAEYVNSLDKKVYNVDKTLINAGGSVSEVLQNIPSVNVDIDGKISLRGSEQVTVFIDGKPAGLNAENRGAILQQLPAATIDQIEVITNPSAKYDAEGISGIINIKTKKDKNPGLNGSVQVGAGTRDKYNASIQLNRRTKSHNAFLNYGYRDDRRFSFGDNTRTNTYFEDSLSYFVSENDGRNDNISHTIRGGVDLYLNDYNTLGMSGSVNLRNEARYDDAITRQEDDDFNEVSFFDRITRTDENNKNFDGSVDYRRTFAGTKKELTASASINRILRDDESQYSTDTSGLVFDQLQRLNTIGRNWNGTAQADLILPFEKFKIETGLKSTYRRNDGRQSSDRYDFTANDWNADTTFTDRFIFTEWVYAGYLQWSGRWKIFELMAGVRAEQTVITGQSESADTNFTRDFLNLFPSGAIKYSFSEGRDVQLNYSRRISRPGQQQLNPFRNISDSINIFVGNPGLLPETTHSLELGYIGRYKEQNVSATLFYRFTDNFSQRFRVVDPVSNITTQTFVNYNTSENLGAELVIRNSFLKVFTSTLTLTAFYNKVNGENIGAGLVSDVWSGDIRGSISTRFSKSFSIQLTGNYMAPREQPQGTFRGMSGIDFGFKYDFKGGKWSLNGSLTDIFDTRNFRVDNLGDGFRVEFTRKRESRVGSFTLSYRFGKAEQSQRPRKQGRPGDMPQNDMLDF
ncbi:MAG: TonB-dependent receptor domain-containing protein [Bacteroidota bacterium]|jgi:iron complex outermembrane receptor protein